MNLHHKSKNPTRKIENPPQKNKNSLEEGPVESAFSGRRVDVMRNTTATAGPHQLPLVGLHWEDPVGVLILQTVQEVASGQFLVRSTLIGHL